MADDLYVNIPTGTSSQRYKVLRAPIAVSGSGDATLVTGVDGYAVVVLSMALTTNGTTLIDFHDSDDTYIWGSASVETALSADGSAGPAGFILPFSDIGHFQTGESAGLEINSSQAVELAGCMSYILI